MKNIRNTLLIIVILFSTVFSKQSKGQCIENTCECVYYSAIQDDTLWVGTKVGLSKILLLNDSIEFFNSSNSGLPCNYIYTIHIDSIGNKWMGTYYGGLVKYDGVNWDIINTGNFGIADNDVFTINFDNNNIL